MKGSPTKNPKNVKETVNFSRGDHARFLRACEIDDRCPKSVFIRRATMLMVTEIEDHLELPRIKLPPRTKAKSKPKVEEPPVANEVTRIVLP